MAHERFECIECHQHGLERHREFDPDIGLWFFYCLSCGACLIWNCPGRVWVKANLNYEGKVKL